MSVESVEARRQANTKVWSRQEERFEIGCVRNQSSGAACSGALELWSTASHIIWALHGQVLRLRKYIAQPASISYRQSLRQTTADKNYFVLLTRNVPRQLQLKTHKSTSIPGDRLTRRICAGLSLSKACPKASRPVPACSNITPCGRHLPVDESHLFICINKGQLCKRAASSGMLVSLTLTRHTRFLFPLEPNLLQQHRF